MCVVSVIDYAYDTEVDTAWINNHIHFKVWDEITHPFLNSNGAAIEV